MASWRSQLHMETSENDDALVMRVQSRARLASLTVTTLPYDHEVSTSGALTDMVAHCQFTNEADARAHYNSLRGMCAPGGVSPVGMSRLGDGFRNSGQVHGKVSVHLCTHGDAVVLPCNESEYSETVF